MEPNFIANINIINFPSLENIINLIDDFFKKNKLEKQYTYQLKNQNNLIIILQNSDIGFSLIKKLKLEQLTNPIFEKMISNLSLGVINPYKNKSIQNKKSFNNSKKFSKLKKNTSMPLIITKLHIKKNANSERNINKKLLYKNYNNNYSIFLPKGPYIDEYQMRINDERKNKSLWLNKKGFNQFAAKATGIKIRNYISNYVTKTPSEYPLNHKFRDENKEKWIIKKNFFL
jgi:hypothetical protein